MKQFYLGKQFLFGKAILGLGVLFEQWNLKNVCILHRFGFVLPWGAAGFSPSCPILMVWSILASPPFFLVFPGFFPDGGGFQGQLHHPPVGHKLPPPLSLVLHLGQGSQGRGLRTSRDLHSWGQLSQAQFKPLSSEHLQSRAWGDDAIGTGEISPSSAHLKQVRSCGKCSGSSTARWEMICPWTAEGRAAKGILKAPLAFSREKGSQGRTPVSRNRSKPGERLENGLVRQLKWKCYS